MSAKVDAVQRELEKIVGPVAKCIVDKQLRNMGYERDNVPDSALSTLIEKVVDAGIFDRNTKKKVRDSMRSAVKPAES